jgi:branched-subunit amino acid aminotransferase/4-amino-4-deoxychorismate lyase
MELNGVPADRVQLSALAMTNYGHFTTMRVADGRVRGLSLHLERLSRDCRIVFGTDLDTERVRYLIRHALGERKGAATVRVTVFDPALELAHPGAAAEPHLLVTTRPAPAEALSPMRVQAARYVRERPEVKHVGLFGTIDRRRRAQLAGFDDVLFTDERSFVAEGATWNVGFFDGEHLVWPRAKVLPGVTMALLNEVHGGPVRTDPVPLRQLPGMGAAFATNAGVGVRAISAVDGVGFAEAHPILDVLRKEYADIPAQPL